MQTTKPKNTTTKLMRMLDTSPNRFYENQVENGGKKIKFEDYMIELMNKYEISATSLISSACISKTYCYQFMNGERLPGRDIAIRMAFGMHLTVEETQRFLTLAEKGLLYPKQKRDAAILYCIREKKTLLEADEMLSEIGELSLISD